MADQALRAALDREVQRRRTFAIISHPDAGKTTLTEKLLLYSGMVRTAGIVGGRKGQRGATSDWMAMEQERGISITASAMQFPYKGTVINILDTPGHQDFSEDTYRTLTAADSAIMVLDAAKGVEEQTRKLFAACRQRGTPVFTFVNKCDLAGREAIELMDEVEEVLRIPASPMNWPVGRHREFRGVVRCSDRQLELYEKVASGGSAVPKATRLSLDEAAGILSEELIEQLEGELELLEAAGNPFDREAFLAGEVTPVFFGSALTNFGVEPLFDAFVDLAPSPSPRPATATDGSECRVDPTEEEFRAYIFKLQANMDPRHRDVVAFLRINSGRFERDMQVFHEQSGKRLRLSRPHTLMVSERATLEEAWPGDIIGIVSPGGLSIGDTVSIKGGLTFPPLPRFQPERFARLEAVDVGKRKSLDKGLMQLASEGTIQLLYDHGQPDRPPFLAAVGQLQFDVLIQRLRDEYKAEVRLSPMPYECSAWLEGDPTALKHPSTSRVVQDADARPMVLFSSIWEKEYVTRENQEHRLLDIA